MQIATIDLEWAPNEGPDPAVIAPTFNERDNVEPLVEKLAATLQGVRREVIFADLVRDVAARPSRHELHCDETCAAYSSGES